MIIWTTTILRYNFEIFLQKKKIYSNRRLHPTSQSSSKALLNKLQILISNSPLLSRVASFQIVIYWRDFTTFLDLFVVFSHYLPHFLSLCFFAILWRRSSFFYRPLSDFLTLVSLLSFCIFWFISLQILSRMSFCEFFLSLFFSIQINFVMFPNYFSRRTQFVVCFLWEQRGRWKVSLVF